MLSQRSLSGPKERLSAQWKPLLKASTKAALPMTGWGPRSSTPRASGAAFVVPGHVEVEAGVGMSYMLSRWQFASSVADCNSFAPTCLASSPRGWYRTVKANARCWATQLRPSRWKPRVDSFKGFTSFPQMVAHVDDAPQYAAEDGVGRWTPVSPSGDRGVETPPGPGGNVLIGLHAVALLINPKLAAPLGTGRLADPCRHGVFLSRWLASKHGSL